MWFFKKRKSRAKVIAQILMEQVMNNEQEVELQRLTEGQRLPSRIGLERSTRTTTKQRSSP